MAALLARRPSEASGIGMNSPIHAVSRLRAPLAGRTVPCVTAKGASMTGLSKYILAAGLIVLAPQAAHSGETRLLRYPDIHGDKIVFCYGGGSLSFLDRRAGRPAASPPGPGKRFSRSSPPTAGGSPSRRSSKATWTFTSCPCPGAAAAPDVPSGRRAGRRLEPGREERRLPLQRAQLLRPGQPPPLRSGRGRTGPGLGAAGGRSGELRRSGRQGGLLPRRPPMACPGATAAGPRPGSGCTIWPGGLRSPFVADGCVNGHPLWIEDRIYYVSDKGDRARPNLMGLPISRAKASRRLTLFRRVAGPLAEPGRRPHRLRERGADRRLRCPHRVPEASPHRGPRSGEPRVEAVRRRRRIRLGRSGLVPRRAEGRPQRPGRPVPHRPRTASPP
ncbi:MAG: hypothetical protein MZV64_13320 [Ignavibacteriales bacterium]|nr:hypothetical protein [Ignavibacteriales bacterium]